MGAGTGLHRAIWECPKIRGTYFAVPIRVPYFRKLPIGEWKRTWKLLHVGLGSFGVLGVGPLAQGPQEPSRAAFFVFAGFRA